MWLKNLFKSRTSPSSRRRPSSARRCLEALEGRWVPSFSQPVSYPVMNPSSLAAADFNADGKIDLASLDNPNHTLNVLLGNGDGTFQPARSFPAGDF